MATILVVDDRPPNRQFLATLLGYGGNRVLEAVDGAEALLQVRAERPDLVIADILMPTMDGYEFVRQLRADPGAASTPVIFYTATYHDREARALAKACGVSYVITKPSEPETILAIVNAALQSAPAPASALSDEQFTREHLRLLIDKLSRANERITALLEVSRQFSTELDSVHLLERLCLAAREITGARYASAFVFEPEHHSLRQVVGSGMETETSAAIGAGGAPDQEILARLLVERQPLRLRDLAGDSLAAGFSASYLPHRSFLGLPLATPSQLYGVLCIVEKLGADEFSQEDQEVATTLAEQAAVAYENLKRRDEIRQHAADLQKRVEQRTTELQSAVEELEAFTYSVSHDLRAPLRHIDGFSRILLEEYAPRLEPTARHYLERIAGGASQMGRLVDDLLALSRIGRQEAAQTQIELGKLVEEVVASLEPEIRDRSIEWRIGWLPALVCDPGLMKLVFANLLSNALKFTRHRQSAIIQVGECTRDGRQAIFVRDNGTGFDMKYAGKLFGVFQRLHRQEDFDGTGVGLATVQRIIRKHGGRIWAEAELDRGATFYFTLGATEAQERAARGGVECQPVS